MLGILLLILKIIGLVLLGILGLFLAVVLLVLFLPLSYRVWVSGDSGEPGQLAYRIKILGIQILPKKEKIRRGRRKSAARPQQTDHSAADRAEASEPALRADQSGNSSPSKDTTKTADPISEKEPAGGAKTSGFRKTDRKAPKKKEKKQEKSATGTDVRAMLSQLHAELTDEGNRRALNHVFSEIRYLLRHFGPRRVRADVSFSLGDPANTGYATAALSVCPFSYGRDCHILPDFEAEQFYLRGWMEVRGHVRTVHALLVLVRLLFDKNIRSILKKVLHQKNKKTKK